MCGTPSLIRAESVQAASSPPGGGLSYMSPLLISPSPGAPDPRVPFAAFIDADSKRVTRASRQESLMKYITALIAGISTMLGLYLIHLSTRSLSALLTDKGSMTGSFAVALAITALLAAACFLVALNARQITSFAQQDRDRN